MAKHKAFFTHNEILQTQCQVWTRVTCEDTFNGDLYSAIHKAAGLTVPGHSMILPGTIPETPISREWSRQLEWPLGVVPTGKNAYRRLCE